MSGISSRVRSVASIPIRNRHLLSTARATALYLYLLFSSVGDVFLMNCAFRVHAIGGVFFLFAHLTLSVHFVIDWRCLPLRAVVLVVAMIAVPGRFFLLQFRTGCFHADSFAVYTAALEIGACSAVAPI
jgi:uncharacterized membrane protein YhhN